VALLNCPRVFNFELFVPSVCSCFYFVFLLRRSLVTIMWGRLLTKCD